MTVEAGLRQWVLSTGVVVRVGDVFRLPRDAYESGTAPITLRVTHIGACRNDCGVEWVAVDGVELTALDRVPIMPRALLVRVDALRVVAS
jgi:hypothetical protein